ncbi:hypothetical protein M2375_003735 [Comamonas sp. BIGb0152]|uniref:DUF4265 domain-containing protein n=1 Tax=Comamonas sp. BIGb0152 TaxID=2940601 RepID=UPI00216A7585|nr:DUF4265 domain-containing protein [Comamonas sp. BIGb0152]MCS4295492.1 hypothetical protein [Comamonas sp. BIGb0152]
MHKKILFNYGDAESDELSLESIWVIPVDRGFKIDNIPFYVRGIALNDIVSAKNDEDGVLNYVSIIQASGHSTIRLWFSENHKKDILLMRNILRVRGCESEQSELSRLVAVDIPPSVCYEGVRAILDEQEKLGVFEYEEACLGFL